MEDGKRGHGSDVMEGILKGVRVLVVREKKKKKRGRLWGRAKRWMQHRDFPGGHPSQYYSGPKALNFRVLMGSGVVALV